MFITFEGGEGAGKSTLITKLKAELAKKGSDVIVTREPGGSKLGEHIRNCLLDPGFGVSFCPKAELLLFLASRAQHIEELILPALKKGKVVLCDRFNDSTIAYQGGGRGLGIEYVEKMCSLVCGDVVPNITFFLDLDPALGHQRIQKQKMQKAENRPQDRIEEETLTFHQKVAEAFRQLAKKHSKRIHILNASASEEEVFKAALHIIDSSL